MLPTSSPWIPVLCQGAADKRKLKLPEDGAHAASKFLCAQSNLGRHLGSRWLWGTRRGCPTGCVCVDQCIAIQDGVWFQGCCFASSEVISLSGVVMLSFVLPLLAQVMRFAAAVI